ncbi:MAG: zinc metalloprotease HtpX [Gammaproteobacteria bacterium]|jgi:heat shock protein HtpX
MDRIRHTRSNRWQSAILILAMVGILSGCGFILLGWTGLFAALAFAIGIVLATGRASAGAVLRMYRAVPIERNHAPGLVQLFDSIVARAGLDHSPQLYYVPSSMLNAFAAGHGKQVAVAITDGILQNMNAREIAGILAHEISHVQNGDVFVMSLADALSRVTAFIGQAGIYMLILVIPSSLLGYGIPWIAALVFMFAPNLSALLQLALSRAREYDADEGAARITGDPIGLAMALKKVDVTHDNWFKRVLLPGRRELEPALLRTHPPTQNRIDALKSMAGIDSEIALTDPVAQLVTIHPKREIVRPRWHFSGLWY